MTITIPPIFVIKKDWRDEHERQWHEHERDWRLLELEWQLHLMDLVWRDAFTRDHQDWYQWHQDQVEYQDDSDEDLPPFPFSVNVSDDVDRQSPVSNFHDKNWRDEHERQWHEHEAEWSLFEQEWQAHPQDLTWREAFVRDHPDWYKWHQDQVEYQRYRNWRNEHQRQWREREAEWGLLEQEWQAHQQDVDLAWRNAFALDHPDWYQWHQDQIEYQQYGDEDFPPFPFSIDISSDVDQQSPVNDQQGNDQTDNAQ